MDSVVSILGSFLFEAGRLLCGSAYTRLSFIIKIQSNVEALERELRNLLDLKNSVGEEIKLAEVNGTLLTTEVKDWLTEVEEIELKVNSLLAEIKGKEEKLRGCCLNCSLRYRLGREAAMKLNEVKQVLGSGNSPRITSNFQVKPVEQIPGPSIGAQKRASEILNELQSLLNDDGVSSVGVWGMGGVGKTTLIKNLNNELAKLNSTQPFNVVIWVTISKDWDLGKVQDQIAERLNLVRSIGENIERMAIRLFRRLRHEKKFLLILDDVWERVDLDKLGVPTADVHQGCKIILTTRSKEVCGEMKTDVDVKVDVLSDEEAWELFVENAGNVVYLQPIRPIAKHVARECGGLPLAIITVGRAMRGKTKVELWKNALQELRRSLPYIKGIEKELFLPLKWSYDSLQGENIKPCFLYCSLFPEDYSIKIEELIHCWVAEGLIDGQNNLEESFNGGVALIEKLKDTCLLECGENEGTVKLHDVVRDVAIWIASSLEDGTKHLVRSGMGLSMIPESVMETWKLCKRASFMNNSIVSLPDCVMECSMVSTLFLQGNTTLTRVPEVFLQGFPALRVLNLSGTHVRSLPPSLVKLSELRALFLRDCYSLKELPPLGGLSRLQVLDLRGSHFQELPKGIEELRNLRHLNLSHMPCLETVQAGVISGLSLLEVLDMKFSSYKWDVKGKAAEGTAAFEELGSLENLIEIFVRLENISCISSEDLTWMKSLKRFHLCVGPSSYSNFVPMIHDECTLVLRSIDLSIEKNDALLSYATALVVESCIHARMMWERLVLNNAVTFAGLKSLTITGCDMKSSTRVATNDFSPVLLPNLEELSIHHFKYIQNLGPLRYQLGFRFSSLKLIKVVECNMMGGLMPDNDCNLEELRNLEELKVSSCKIMWGIIGSRSETLLPKLRIMEFKNLPKLTNICLGVMKLPCLEQIEVQNCRLLMSLPFSAEHLNEIKVVRGELQWWNQLQWTNEKIKCILQPYFQPQNHLGRVEREMPL